MDLRLSTFEQLDFNLVEDSLKGPLIAKTSASLEASDSHRRCLEWRRLIPN